MQQLRRAVNEMWNCDLLPAGCGNRTKCAAARSEGRMEEMMARGEEGRAHDLENETSLRLLFAAFPTSSMAPSTDTILLSSSRLRCFSSPPFLLTTGASTCLLICQSRNKMSRG